MTLKAEDFEVIDRGDLMVLKNQAEAWVKIHYLVTDLGWVREHDWKGGPWIDFITTKIATLHLQDLLSNRNSK